MNSKITTTVREVGQRFGHVATVTVGGRAYEGDVVPFGFTARAIDSARAKAGLGPLPAPTPVASPSYQEPDAHRMAREELSARRGLGRGRS